MCSALLTWSSLPSMLYKLYAFADEEKERHFANITSPDECVSSADTWADRRNEISNTLNGFYTGEKLVVCVLCLML